MCYRICRVRFAQVGNLSLEAFPQERVGGRASAAALPAQAAQRRAPAHPAIPRAVSRVPGEIREKAAVLSRPGKMDGDSEGVPVARPAIKIALRPAHGRKSLIPYEWDRSIEPRQASPPARCRG